MADEVCELSGLARPDTGNSRSSLQQSEMPGLIGWFVTPSLQISRLQLVAETLFRCRPQKSWRDTAHLTFRKGRRTCRSCHESTPSLRRHTSRQDRWSHGVQDETVIRC